LPAFLVCRRAAGSSPDADSDLLTWWRTDSVIANAIHERCRFEVVRDSSVTAASIAARSASSGEKTGRNKPLLDRSFHIRCQAAAASPGSGSSALIPSYWGAGRHASAAPPTVPEHCRGNVSNSRPRLQWPALASLPDGSLRSAEGPRDGPPRGNAYRQCRTFCRCSGRFDERTHSITGAPSLRRKR